MCECAHLNAHVDGFDREQRNLSGKVAICAAAETVEGSHLRFWSLVQLGPVVSGIMREYSSRHLDPIKLEAWWFSHGC